MQEEDHFPAFPVVAGTQVYATGMTMRDWLAANAPVAIFDAAAACGFPDLFQAMNDKKQRIAVFKALVAMRFEYADAMLEARK